MTELSELARCVRSFPEASVAVVGDLILDEYVEGAVRRVSPEAPVPVLSVERSFFRLGGAANVAHLAAALGARASVVGCVGDDEAGARLVALLTEANIDAAEVARVEGRPTTRKLRALAQHQQLVRLDWETTSPWSDAPSRVRPACDRMPALGAIVLSDYGKGVVSRALVRELSEIARERSAPLLVDPKSRDLGLYRGATLLTPNLRELEEATGRALADASDAEIAEVARAAMTSCELGAMVVTLGHRGILTVPRDGAAAHIAAHAKEVFDVTGAGDAVIAAFALALARGRPLSDAAAIANAAAGVVVGKIGTAVVTRGELVAALSPHLGKVIDRPDVGPTVKALRREGRKIVFTNGCFDLLHGGHLELLREAARLGDALIVGLNTDASVRAIKGPSRPIVPEGERAEIVAALDCVTFAVLFDEPTPRELVSEIEPDVLVKGADYALSDVVGRDAVEARGGRVVLVPLKAGLSTSDRIRALKR